MSETQKQNAKRNGEGAQLASLVELARAKTLALLTGALATPMDQRGPGTDIGADAGANIGATGVEIRFDLRGKAAGQVRMGTGARTLIRYNLELLRRETADFLEHTVPHEVAHVLAYRRYGLRIRPHGPQWQRIMRQLGAEPSRCHDYDVSGLSARQLQYFDYHCSCRAHRLSSIRHNKVAKGQRYLCRRCGEPLKHGARSAAG